MLNSFDIILILLSPFLLCIFILCFFAIGLKLSNFILQKKASKEALLNEYRQYRWNYDHNHHQKPLSFKDWRKKYEQ